MRAGIAITEDFLSSREETTLVAEAVKGEAYFGKVTYSDIREITAAIRSLMDGASGEERCLSLNEGRDAVHMANLHKVKGLEAPVVILSAATRLINSCEKRIIHGDDGSEGYLFALSKEDNKGNYFETGHLRMKRKMRVKRVRQRIRDWSMWLQPVQEMH